MQNSVPDNIENEIWKDIPIFMGFQSSSFGRIRTIDRNIEKFTKNGSHTYFRKGRVLNQILNHRGYLEVRIYCGKIKNLTQTVHKLVALSFLGFRPEGLQINHKNGIKTDNRPENLEYISPSENIKHAFKIGLKSAKGERNSNSKLTFLDVERIRKRYTSEDITQNELSFIFGVTQAQISSIIRRESWIV